MKIKYFILILTTTILLTSTPIIAQTHNPATQTGDYNLEVTLTPGRHILPRIHAEATYATFEITVMNQGPDTSNNYTLNFYIKNLFSPKPGISYDQTWYEGTLDPNRGRGHPVTIRCICTNTLLSIYQARASIDINDNKLLDNQASFFYIVLEN